MKRACIPALLILLLLFGCMPSSQEQVYYVMFKGAPQIFDDGVYFRGEPIGEVLAAEIGDTLISKVTISVPESSRHLVQTRTAFVVSAGRLHLEQLSAYGEPLPLGAALAGFSSKGALYRFRLTHLLRPLPEAAAARAQRLMEFDPEGAMRP